MKNVRFGMSSGTDSRQLAKAKERGADYVDLHFNRDTGALLGALRECERLGLGYVLNVEGLPLDWQFPAEVREHLEHNDAYLGVMLDECDHMQLNAHWTVVEYYGYEGHHYFADTDGLSLRQAQAAVGEAIARRVENYRVDSKDVAGEYLFPVMMHAATAAGLSPSPKVLKETAGPVMLAVGLGAALQYGGPFAVDVDGWWHPELIGHTPERYTSALLMAYWSGADRVYIEGGYGDESHWLQKECMDRYERFVKEYAPAHPRPYSWRDFQPDIAIVRFDDTCFDTRQQSPLYYPGPLYGHVPAQNQNTEWLNIWNMLSHGYIRGDSASRNWESRSMAARTLFAPLHGVAVFDEKVGYDCLKSARLIFLTGEEISEGTYQAAARRVKEGAVCVLPERLYRGQANFCADPEAHVVPDGAGQWAVLKDLYALHYETWTSGVQNKKLHDLLAPLIGDGDTLDLRFGRQRVKFTQKHKEPAQKTWMGGDIPRIVWDAEDDLDSRFEKE